MSEEKWTVAIDNSVCPHKYYPCHTRDTCCRIIGRKYDGYVLEDESKEICNKKNCPLKVKESNS